MAARQERSSRATERMMLTWDEKVEKQPRATELSLKEKRRQGGEGRRVGILALGGGRKLNSEAACTVWSYNTGASLQTLKKHTAMDKVANVKMLKA